MEIRKSTLIVLAAACLAAGAGGAWLLRGGPAEAPAPAPEAAVAEAGPIAQAATVPEDTPAAVAQAEPAPRPAAPPAPVVSPRIIRDEPAPAAPAREPERAEPAAPEPAIQDDAPAEPAISALPELPVEPEPTVLAGALPEAEFEELIVGADSVIGLRLSTTVSSETARVEDEVEARVSRDVLVGGHVAVPAGAVAIGSVTMVDQGGRLRDPARLTVRFHTLRLPDGTSVEIDSDPIYREGDAPGGESAATIGGSAIGGAIIGGLLGGARGAIIGGTAGAGAGTAAAMATGNDPAVIASGAQVTIRLVRPFSVVVER